MKRIEIFKPGRHTAKSGHELDFTESRLRESAEAYDPAVHEAPIVVGHPKTDHPAYGWVRGLEFAEGTLIAEPDQVNPDFEEMVKSGHFKKISASFYRPESRANPKPGVYYLRHVGFLGAQPPSVKGLKPVEFSDGGDDVVELEFGETEKSMSRVLRGIREWVIEMAGIKRADQVVPDYEIRNLERDGDEPEYNEKTEDDEMTEKERRRMREEVEAEFAEREKELARAERKQKRARHEAAARELVESGKVLPRHQSGLADFMEAVDAQNSEAVVEFAEDKDGGGKKLPPADWLQKFLADLPRAVDYSEHGSGEDDPQEAYETPSGYSVDGEKARLHRQALDYQEEHDCEYVTALRAVTKKNGGK